MSTPMTYRIVVSIILLLGAASANAQRIDTIKANPDAKPLRKIWEVTGGATGSGRVGTHFGSCGDINQDGYEDWAVNFGDANQLRIYYGSEEPLDTTPVMVLDSIGYSVVGDFWGTGHTAVGFTAGKLYDDLYYYALRLLRTDSNRLDTAAPVLLDLHRMNPPVQSTPTSVAAADLDGDGYDELVMMFAGRTVNNVSTRKPEVWIYRGGPEFQVDSPTVVIRDNEINGGRSRQFMSIGNWDSDGQPDLVFGSDYADGINKVTFFFSSNGSPWNWTAPDRVVPMSKFTPLDCDGDGLLDIAVGDVVLFLSRGKDIRTRSFTSEDIDHTLYASYARFVPGRVGYVNDSARRYEMLDIRFNGIDHFLGGGPSGPDGFYEASSGDDATAFIQPAGDINGDGWDDLIGGWPDVNFDAGVAAVFAGGPYIPRDPSLGVRAVAGEGHPAAIRVWPNPATTELHIAWRGDLKRMPRGYRIHDINGALVAQGETPSWRGEMLWQCRDVAAGNYVLSIYDWQWQLLGTTTIIRQ